MTTSLLTWNKIRLILQNNYDLYNVLYKTCQMQYKFHNCLQEFTKFVNNTIKLTM